MKNKKNLSHTKKLSLLLAVLFMIIFVPQTISQSDDWTILASWPIPGQASGLATDGTFFYFGIYGADGDEVYQFDPSTGNAVLLFSSANLEDSFGMTFDGTHLWVSDHANSSNDPAYAMQFDFAGNLLDQFDLPDHYMSGLCYDNGDFWVATYYPDPGTIYKVDINGNILNQFQYPGDQPWDLCLENDNFWFADYNDDMIYKTDMAGTLLESHASENVQPSGITYDGQYLWYVDGAQTTSKIYKVDLGGAGTPEIEVPVEYYNYGNVAIGDSAVWNCTVNNIGTVDLEINNLVIQNAVPIFLWMTFAQIIEPGESLDIPLIFKPTETGSLNTIVTIESSDPVTPQVEVELVGEAVYDGPHITVPVTSHNYNNVRMGATTRWFLEIYNDGSLPLEVSDITIDDIHFYLDDNIIFPFNVNVLESAFIGIWFHPEEAISYSALAEIFHNDATQGNIDVSLTGDGIEDTYLIGNNLWGHTINTSWDNSVKAILAIPDVNGDGVNDVIVGSEDSFVRCFNGNASGSADILWENEIGDVFNQNDLYIIEDIDNDGFDDVIAGKTGIGSVNALSGKTGDLIWSFSTAQFGDGGWIYQVWAGYDYNDDGTNDVLASSGGSATGSRRIFCVDGLTGNDIWVKFTDGPNFSVIGVEDFTGDGKPDVIGGASNYNETEGKVFGINGENGNIEWTHTTTGSSVWALEQMDDLNNDGIKDIIAGCSLSNYYYFLDASTGSVINSGATAGSFILRFEKLDDVNGDGFSDFAVAKSGSDAFVIDGQVGGYVWTTSLADQSWNIDRIEDVNGDGINDVIIGTLFSSNFCYFLDGITGETIHSFNFGEPVDGIGVIPDITGDGSMEMIAGGREGKLYCYSGGINTTSPLVADFMADTTFGYIPFDVNFTDLSLGNITNWEWDFDNDGEIDSYEQNPTYNYTEIGLFSVKLIVSNSVTSDTVTKLDYITADSTVNVTTKIVDPGVLASPNPFSDQTNISYDLEGNSIVSVEILNLNGEKIKTIISSVEQKSGHYQLHWNRTNNDGILVEKGIYFVNLNMGNVSRVMKLIVN